jgi:dTMP kinase
MAEVGSGGRGRFITFEGVEGVGKSTNIAHVADLVAAAGHEVLVTREPGGTPLGEQVRALLLSPGARISPMAELLLMFAARAAHLEEVIRPALGAGQWVICDRFTDASYAYQGAGRGLSRNAIAQLENLVQGDLRPDLTLLLDAPAEISERRQKPRPDRFEQEGRDFFNRVRDAYRAMASEAPGRIRIVDAARPLEDVQRDIGGHVRELL